MAHASTGTRPKLSKSRGFLAGVMSALLALMLCPATALATPAADDQALSGMAAVDRAVQQAGTLPQIAAGATSSTSSIGFNEGISLLANPNLPSSFDLRNVDKNGDGTPENYVSSVKLQNPWGTCWAFGSIAAMEISTAYDMGLPSTEQELDFSERHLAYFTSSPLPEDDGDNQGGEGLHVLGDALNKEFTGGTPTFATSMVSSGIGPVTEELAPYRGENGYVANREHHRIVNGQVVDNEGNVLDEPATEFEYWSGDDWTVPEDLRFVSALHIQDSNILPDTVAPIKNEHGEVVDYAYDEGAMDAMKAELLKGHAIAIAFSADNSRPDQVVTGKYINLDTWAHYTYDGSPANHEVCIVGYDDNYSKSNFNAGHQPPADGAWIVKNSWGAADNEFPNHNQWGVDGSGYFYISYYDPSISGPETFEFNVANTTQNDEFSIGQYDYMPSTSTPNINSETPIYMANVFSVPEGIAVRALSTQTSTANTTVTYDLYRLNPDYTSPTDGTLVASVSESYPFAGYHRVELDRSYPFAPGSMISIVVTTLRADGTYEISYDQCHSKLALDLEAVLAKANGTYDPAVYCYYSEGVINPGESFVGAVDGGGAQWNDWSTYMDKTVQESLAEMGELGILDAVENEDASGINQAMNQVKNTASLYETDNFPIKFYAEFLEYDLPFTDLGLGDGETPHWAASGGYIGAVYHAGIMSGYADGNGNSTGLFGPNDVITRAQVASTLFQLSGPTDEQTIANLAVAETKFTDVSPDDWFAARVKWAEQQGLLAGSPSEGGVSARPNDPITREELATVLLHYCNLVNGDTSDNPDTTYRTAPDASSVSGWAASAMEWAFDHGIITGYDTGNLGPQNATTRAEYATMLVKADPVFPTLR